MSLPDGYSDVGEGKLAAVVTSLEMFSRPPVSSDVDQADLTLRHMPAPDPVWYRDLYRRVGGPWLWSSSLTISEEDLKATIHNPLVEVRTVLMGDRDEGLMQLDFCQDGVCELLYFGLTDAIIGRGAGRWLMNRAIECAWSRPINRFWVHTCSIDHPSALDFYIRSGFVPFRRQVEIFDDPRLIGVLPEDAAPHVPILRPKG